MNERTLDYISEGYSPIGRMVTQIASIKTPYDAQIAVAPEDASLLERTVDEGIIEAIKAREIARRHTKSYAVDRVYEIFNREMDSMVNAIHNAPKEENTNPKDLLGGGSSFMLPNALGEMMLELVDIVKRYTDDTPLVIANAPSIFYRIIHDVVVLSFELNHIRFYETLFLEGTGDLSDQFTVGPTHDLRAIFAEKLGIKAIHLDEGKGLTIGPPSVRPLSYLYPPKVYDSSREGRWAGIIEENFPSTDKALLIAHRQHFSKYRAEMGGFYGQLPKLLNNMGIQLQEVQHISPYGL